MRGTDIEVKQISIDDGASNTGEVILITTPSHLGRILSVGDEVMMLQEFDRHVAMIDRIPCWTDCLM